MNTNDSRPATIGSTQWYKEKAEELKALNKDLYIEKMCRIFIDAFRTLNRPRAEYPEPFANGTFPPFIYRDECDPGPHFKADFKIPPQIFAP